MQHGQLQTMPPLLKCTLLRKAWFWHATTAEQRFPKLPSTSPAISHIADAASSATRQNIPHLHELHGAREGVIFTRTLDSFRISASHYSIGQCVTSLFQAMFWNAITGSFISINTMATLRLLGVRDLAGISLPVITGTGAMLGKHCFHGSSCLH